MEVNFYAEYNSMKSTLTVKQNGSIVSKYSQFSHCNSVPFWQWYKNIADYCFHEANGMYRMHFVGGQILNALLEKELCSQTGCSHFSFEPEIITGVDRMYLLDELVQFSQFKARNCEIEISFDRTKLPEIKNFIDNNHAFQYLDLKVLPIYLRIRDTIQYTSNVIILSSMEEYYRIVNGKNSSLPKLVVLIKNTNLRFLEEQHGHFLFSCETHKLSNLIKSWISDVLFPVYASPMIQSLKSCRKWSTIDYPTALKLTDALCDGIPYLDLSVTTPIELSMFGSFKLTRFPKNIPCRIYSSNGKIALLGEGGVIKPIGEGTAEIIAEVKGHPEIRISKKITVFKYKKVQKIHLIASNTNVTVGDQITVRCELFPKDANNISLGKWQIIPSRSMKISSGISGIFQAVNPGVCEIVYSVGNIQERLSIHVSAKPSAIRFPAKSVSVKLSDPTQRLSAVVHPQGAKGGTIKYKISNPNILDFDSNNGQITPKCEGDCVITAILLDRNGTIIDDSHCTINILAPQDIKTPEGALVLLIISLIGSLFLMNNNCQFLCGISGLVGSVWYAYNEKNKRSYLISAVIFILIVFLICMGGTL